MNKLLTVLSVALMAAVAVEAAEVKKVNPFDEVNALERDLEKAKKPFRVRAEEMRKLLAEPRIGTNYAARVNAQKKIAQWCLMRTWLNNWYYDYDLIKEIYPKMMPEILGGNYNDIDKLWFVGQYYKYFAVVEKYDEGVAMIREQIGKLKFRNPKDTAQLYLALAEMNRLADRYEPAVAAAKEAMAFDNDAGALEGARLASDWQDEATRRDFILKMSAPCAAKFVAPVEQNRWQREVPQWINQRLCDFVLDASNPALDRINVFCRALYRDLTPTGEKMMAAMLALPEKEIERADYRSDMTVGVTFQCGSWARCAKLYELALRSKSKAGSVKAANWKRIYLTALYGAGRTADAIRYAKEFAAGGGAGRASLPDGNGKATQAGGNGREARPAPPPSGREARPAPPPSESVAPLDKAVYTGFAALFAGEPIEPAVKDLATSKDKAEAIKLVARCAMTVAKTDVAEKLEKTYAGYFQPRPKREMNVTFSEEPIRSISDWRKIYAKLPKGACDIPFGEGMNLADLVSDVTTQREVNMDESGKKPTIQMEMTCVADRYALHLFLRTPDPQARDVEHGFVNGITTEMYFAPGLDEPYICFGSNPLKGVTFLMNTLYDSLANKRLKLAKDGGNLQSEVAFTDTDYVVHVTFPWSDFYQKLPQQAGTAWKFDCIAWAPTGPMTWGGSRGIHHSSDWGHLVFNLKPAELASIKREIILANYKTWSTPKSTGSYRTLDWCEKWSENRVGDKPFYDKCLKDYGAKLKELQAKVTPKMDDATVNEVYDNGLVHWLGIRYEIDAKRKNYLADELLKGE